MTLPADLSFLAPPGEVADWRTVLLCEAAVAAGLFDNLPGTVDEVVGRAGLDPGATRVVLDALTTLGVVVADSDGRYALGPAAPEKAAMAGVRHHARAMRRWANALEPALRGKTPATDVIDYDLFFDALARNARKAAPGVVDVCLERFPEARRVLDLGGLHGEYALEFTRRGLKATMQDKPEVIDVGRRRGHLEAAGVELFEGSFFDVVPDGPFDLAFCSGITHTFDGEHNLALYRNLRKVVAPGGGVAVVTFLRGRNPLIALFAVQMLLNDKNGDTHTESEYREWLGETGFTVDEGVVDLPEQGARSVLFAT
jgi:SAM-dependent methyltransferase